MGEAALTAIYLSTVARWLADDSPGAERTHGFLDRLLAGAERAALKIAPRTDDGRSRRSRVGP